MASKSFLLRLLFIIGLFQVQAFAWKSPVLQEPKLNCGAPDNQDVLLGSPPTGYTCPSTSPPDNIQPDPNDCSKYYTCYFGADSCYYQCRVQNGEQLVYDLNFNGCNFQLYTNCGNRPLPGTTSKCPTPNGFYAANPAACTADFNSCVKGVSYPYTCPETSLFDPDLRYCVPSNECNVNNSGFTCPTPDGFFPVSANQCSSNYYVCIKGVPYETTCPNSEVFDPLNHNCIEPGTGICS